MKFNLINKVERRLVIIYRRCGNGYGEDEIKARKTDAAAGRYRKENMRRTLSGGDPCEAGKEAKNVASQAKGMSARRKRSEPSLARHELVPPPHPCLGSRRGDILQPSRRPSSNPADPFSAFASSLSAERPKCGGNLSRVKKDTRITAAAVAMRLVKRKFKIMI